MLESNLWEKVLFKTINLKKPYMFFFLKLKTPVFTTGIWCRTGQIHLLPKDTVSLLIMELTTFERIHMPTCLLSQQGCEILSDRDQISAFTQCPAASWFLINVVCVMYIPFGLIVRTITASSY